MIIVGIDEVGRGCWAGPLVAGAVILSKPIAGLKDSKKLTKLQREGLAARIHDEALKALDHPEVQKAMAAQGLEVEPGTGAQMAARMKAETAMWAGVIKDAGIKAQ